jgi:colanic acid biosynthesis glycosyl transferase WcaI
VGPHGGTVRRVSYLKHDASVASRTLDHLWVASASISMATKLARRGVVKPDVVVATAPGLPTLIAGRIVAKRLGVPLVAEMRDAWPDLVSHTPGLARGRGPIERVKQRVHEAVTALQRNAAIVVTTTESFADVLREREVGPVHVIRNGTSLERYAVIPPTVHDHDELRVLYIGTIGRSQGLETVVRATAAAREQGVAIETRIVGYGADVARLRALNVALGSPVRLLDRVQPNEVFGHYDWADTTVVALRDWEPFKWTVPSKLYELMATGKHVTAIVAGEAAALVRESNSGDVVPPGDANAVANLWKRLSRDRTLVASRDGGREWIARNAEYDVIGEQYRVLLEEVVEICFRH